MFSLKKAQSAVEYLQTYGWAILVIIVVGIAVWRLGILSPQVRANTVSGFTAIKVLEPTIKYSPNIPFDVLNFKVMNARGLRIEISSDITLEGDCSGIVLEHNPPHRMSSQSDCDGAWNPDPVGPKGWCYGGVNTHLNPGETYSPLTSCAKLAPGEQFEVEITFKYYERVGKTTIERYDKGVIRGYVSS